MATNKTLLEGERFISEALLTGQQVDMVVATAAFWKKRQDLLTMCSTSGISTALVNQVQLKILCKTETPAGVLAVVDKPRWQEHLVWRRQVERPFFGLIAVGMQDPGNVGSILRTLAAADGQGCWLSPDCADTTSPKTIRASAGALYKCATFENKDPLRILAACQQKEIQTVAAVPSQGRPYGGIDFTKPTMLVIGGEGSGLTEEIRQHCDQQATIPMPGEMESLNASVAAAILIYEMLRQRKMLQFRQRSQS